MAVEYLSKLQEDDILKYYWNHEEFNLEYETLRTKFGVGSYYLVKLIDD